MQERPPISVRLEEFTQHGLPALSGYSLPNISKKAWDLLIWITNDTAALEKVYDLSRK